MSYISFDIRWSFSVRKNKYLFRFFDSKMYSAQDSFPEVTGTVFLRITSLVKFTLVCSLFYIQALEEEWENFHKTSLRLSTKVTPNLLITNVSYLPSFSRNGAQRWGDLFITKVPFLDVFMAAVLQGRAQFLLLNFHGSFLTKQPHFFSYNP